MYRLKDWNMSARRLEKRRKQKNWLGTFWKSCIFVPPTPGSELKKKMQDREEQLRAGGRESWPIKIIELQGVFVVWPPPNLTKSQALVTTNWPPPKIPKYKIV